jgi:hypothetical protein
MDKLMNELANDAPENTTAPQCSPLPWETNPDSGIIYGQTMGEDDEAPFACDVAHDGMQWQGVLNERESANARLITAAANAIGEAAKHLNTNPVELAERLENGGLVALIEAAKRLCKGMNDDDEMEIAYGNSDLEQALARLTGKPENR